MRSDHINPCHHTGDKTTALYIAYTYRHIMLYRISSATRAVASAAATSVDVHIFSPFPSPAFIVFTVFRDGLLIRRPTCVYRSHTTRDTRHRYDRVGGVRGTAWGGGWTTPRARLHSVHISVYRRECALWPLRWRWRRPWAAAPATSTNRHRRRYRASPPRLSRVAIRLCYYIIIIIIVIIVALCAYAFLFCRVFVL